jgi:tRNA dihydrouridine synthase A
MQRFGTPQDVAEEGPITLQIGGSDPSKIRHCLSQISKKYCFQEINLNCGCPSIDSGGASSYGASLMKQPELTGKLLRTMRAAVPGNTDISLKCRIAALDTLEDEADKSEVYENLHRYVSVAANAGISHLILHARPAILSGLSPVKNRQVPALDYNVVDQISLDFPELRVTLNGGITDLDGIRQRSSLVSSFMAGRWMLRRPLDLLQVSSHIAADRGDFFLERGSTALAVGGYLDQIHREGVTSDSLQDILLPMYLVSEQLREDYEAHLYDEPGREPVLCEDEISNLHAALVEGLQSLESATGRKGKQKISATSINFKKLSSSFKGLVGAKVTNKWKRNRAEL